MSAMLGIYIMLIVVGNTLAMWWLIRWTAKPRDGESAQGTVTGHTWDDDLSEYNNPMPRWWLITFYLTIGFTGLYLLLFPGSGVFSGVLGWSSTGQWQEEMKAAETEYGPIFKKYGAMDIAAVAKDPQAREMGQRLFLQNCAVCHGSNAKGGPGFPNLADNDWLWGGTPEAIKTSIVKGRKGVMPAWGPALGDQGVEEVAHYIMSLGGGLTPADPAKAEAGKARYNTMCVACHLPTGTGNQALGAPNLTDKTWLYGGNLEAVKKSIREGRNGNMPAHEKFFKADTEIGNGKVHLLAGYVLHLSQGK